MNNRSITYALSARWYTYPERFRWIADHGFGLEYTPGPGALDLLPAHVAWLLNAGVAVRYHGFFPGHEFAHSDRDLAEQGLRVHMDTLQAMHGCGEQVITVHVGLKRLLVEAQTQNSEPHPGNVSSVAHRAGLC